MGQIKFKAGDSVVVKQGTKDPDTGDDISAWQGRVSEIKEEEGKTMLCIVWDSITLKNLPFSQIERCEIDGLDWQSYYLGADEVDPTNARDTEEEVDETIDDILTHTAWLYLDEEGKRIQKVLDGIDPDDTMALLDAWKKHLDKKLSFPFETEVVEFTRHGPLRIGDRVTVTGISVVDDLYGIIVEVRRGKEKFDFPLCDLEASNQQSKNYPLVHDYVVWYANR